MVKQIFDIKAGDGDHSIIYQCDRLTGKIRLTIDGDKYELKSKFLFIGLARKERFILGDMQAVLDVSAAGQARIICPGAQIIERRTK